MPEEDVKLRFTTEGAEETGRSIDDITKKMVELTKKSQLDQWVKQNTVNLQAQKGAFSQLGESLKGMFTTFQQGQGAAQSLGSGVNVLGSAFRALASPVGIATVAIGAIAAVTVKFNNAAKEMYQELRQLSTLTGMSAKDSEDLKDTFQLAGLSAESLGTAMFRMGAALETGGKQFEEMGVSIRKSTGELKTEGELFLEVRDRLSGMADASQRNAVARQFFGRGARELMPILAMEGERYKELSDAAAQNSAVTDRLMERTANLIKVQADLAQKSQKLKMAFAEMVTVPLETFFLNAVEAAGKFAKGIGSFFGRLFGRKATPEEPAPAVEKDRAVAVEKTNQRLLEHEAKLLRERGRLAEELRLIEIEGEEKRAGMLARIRTGSEEEAIKGEMRLSEERVRIAQERFDREVDIQRRTTGGVASEDMLRMEKERDLAIAKEREKLGELQIRQSEAVRQADEKRMEESLRVTKALGEQRVALLEGQHQRELAINQVSLEDTVAQRTKQQEIEERFTQETSRQRVNAIEAEAAALRQQLSKYSENADARRQIEGRLLELQTERLRVETDTDTKIVQQRASMVREMQSLAQQEASIGDQLTNKAIENLRKRGRTRISQADVEAEALKIRERGAETAASYSMGGRVGIEDLQGAMGTRGMFAQMSQMGTSIAGAMQQMIQQMLGAFSGQRQQFMPTTMQGQVPQIPGASMQDPSTSADFYRTDPQMQQAMMNRYLANQELGRAREQQAMGGLGTGPETAKADGLMTKITDTGDRVIQQLETRLPEAFQNLFERFSDSIIRQIEFQSARS